MHPIAWPGEPAGDADRGVVATQLGRDPRGAIAIVARCPYGLPAVVRTSPRLDDGTPFPTLYYLTCPVAVRLIGRVEASGRMASYNDLLTEDENVREAYARAHERYVSQRDSLELLGDDTSAGGMPTRVKCLHALYAHEVADGNPIGAFVRPDVEPLVDHCPGPCVIEGERVRGHPGFAGKKRRR
jgi:hypothetical protein